MIRYAILAIAAMCPLTMTSQAGLILEYTSGSTYGGGGISAG